jgi:hypothetical protein
VRPSVVVTLGAGAAACACLLLLACGSLDSPTQPAPTPDPVAVVTPTAQPGPLPTPIFGTPTSPSPSPSPSTTPDSPEPSTTPPPASAGGCGQPLPPPLSSFNVKVHQRGTDAWILDSTPLVADAKYCAAIGFTDGRSSCPVRPEGNPEREACELYVVGRAKDTGRPGPTWYNGTSFCQGPSSAAGCDNHPDNQYQAIVYKGGTFKACGQNGVCGEVVADR